MTYFRRLAELQSQFQQVMDVLNKSKTAPKHDVNLQHVQRCRWSNSPDKREPDTENTDETTELAVEDHVVIN